MITIAPTEGERYQGVIGLDKPTITECLEDYFVRSEQLQTQLIIRTGEYEGKPVAAGCCCKSCLMGKVRQRILSI